MQQGTARQQGPLKREAVCTVYGWCCLGQAVLLQAPLPQLADIGFEEVVHGDCALEDGSLGR